MKKLLFRYFVSPGETVRNLITNDILIHTGRPVMIKGQWERALSQVIEEIAKKAWEVVKIERGTWDAFSKIVEKGREIDISYMFELEPDYRGLFYEAYRLKGTQFILEVPVTKDGGLSWGQYTPHEDPDGDAARFDDIDFTYINRYCKVIHGELESVEFTKVFEESPSGVQEDLMMHFDIFGE